MFQRLHRDPFLLLPVWCVRLSWFLRPITLFSLDVHTCGLGGLATFFRTMKMKMVRKLTTRQKFQVTRRILRTEVCQPTLS